MYKMGVAMLILVVLLASLAGATPPLVELEPGVNKLALRMVNKGTIDLRSIHAVVDQEELPEWLKVTQGPQCVDVPGGSESVERLILEIEVKEGAGEDVFELPLTFKDEGGGSWKSTVLLQVKANLPVEYQLSQNFPNPFNPDTMIRYALTSREGLPTRLVIFNALGQKIRTLVDEPQVAGFYSVRWDGRDDQGQRLSSGTYFYRLTSGGFVKVQKMALIE